MHRIATLHGSAPLCIYFNEPYLHYCIYLSMHLF